MKRLLMALPSGLFAVGDPARACILCVDAATGDDTRSLNEAQNRDDGLCVARNERATG
jgi:hypothetical protein